MFPAREDNLIADLHGKLCALLPQAAAEVFANGFETRAKGSCGLDLVTSVDLAMQARLETGLAALLPGSLVVGEEDFTGAPGDAPFWLVDPLDGTVNFVAGLPAYSVAAVLIEGGQPVLSAVYDVPNGMVFSAIAGKGAFADGVPLQRQESPARLAIVSSGLLRDLATRAPDQIAVLLQEFKLRNFGSQALHLCYAAAGRVSMVASREAKGWDDLAGALVAREAGLAYGPYHTPAERPPAMDADQFSLCAPADLFDNYAPLFARSAA
ncbi:inositol monophosphatase family protein [Leisingera sp. ANG-M7]|uniref:inositol monophosphatase family protein n=1 Tax=Leisingera sp. ANG-M7 TaxID=1577902 RepID=UPI00068B88E3|nr:inositol monophosphatase family protein [Leisingera sp. ANG-M7]